MLSQIRDLFPHQTDFFVLFEQNAHHLVEAGQVVVQALERPDALREQAARMKNLEHAADTVTHQVMAERNRGFIVPFDRGDVSDLAHALDDVVEFMEAVLTRMLLFKLGAPAASAQELARVALQPAEIIDRAVPRLRHADQQSNIQGDLIEINRLQNAADRLLEQALTTLFDQPRDLADLIERLKWREVYELLGTATDCAEDVANVLEAIVSKNA